MTTRPRLFVELRRRNVFRAATFYAASAWLLVEVVTQLVPVFDIPGGVVRWIVIAAVSSDRFPGFVETVATPGGKRGPGIERYGFLIPSAEYEPGLFGFVVDPARHQGLTDGDG